MAYGTATYSLCIYPGEDFYIKGTNGDPLKEKEHLNDLFVYISSVHFKGKNGSNFWKGFCSSFPGSLLYLCLAFSTFESSSAFDPLCSSCRTKAPHSVAPRAELISSAGLGGFLSFSFLTSSTNSSPFFLSLKVNHVQVPSQHQFCYQSMSPRISNL